MFKVLNRLVLSALLATASSQAIAQSSDWVVSEARGTVTIISAEGKTRASRGSAVNAGDTVVTGSGARAVLVHNKDFVTLASDSRIRIPAEARSSGITRFFQEVGNAIFNVEKRGTPHFSVDTPYLAAVVKGTVFSVTVGADNTSLQVTEGAVEVATHDGGAREIIRPGSIAMIASTDRYRLNISGDQAGVVDSPARQEATEIAPAASTAPLPTASEPANENDGKVPANTPKSSAASPKETVGVRINTVVSSKPVDLASATNGLVSGMSPVATAAAGLTKTAFTQVDGEGFVNAGGAGKVPGAPAAGRPSELPATADSSADAGKPEAAGKPADVGKPDKGEKPEHAGKPGKGDKPEDTGKPDKSQKPEDAGKPGKGDKPEDAGKSGKGDKPEDTGKPDKGDKPEDAGKPGKGDKPEDTGKPDKGEKPEDAGKPGKGDKPEDAGKPGKGDKPEDAGKPGKGDKPEDAGKPGKGDKPEDAGKPGKGDKPEDASKPGPSDKPTDAGKPGPADKPEDAGKPGKGDKPDDASKPGTADKPSDAGKPEPADKPGDAGKPGPTDKPSDTGKPGPDGKPNDAAKPGPDDGSPKGKPHKPAR